MIPLGVSRPSSLQQFHYLMTEVFHISNFKHIAQPPRVNLCLVFKILIHIHNHATHLQLCRQCNHEARQKANRGRKSEDSAYRPPTIGSSDDQTSVVVVESFLINADSRVCWTCATVTRAMARICDYSNLILCTADA